MSVKNAQPLPEWTPDQGVVDSAPLDILDAGYPEPVTISSKSGKPLKRTLNKNSTTPGFYNRIVKLGDCRIFLRNVSDANSEVIKKADAAYNAVSTGIQAKNPDALDALDDALTARQGAYYPVIKDIVQGWDLPDDEGNPWPCNEENIECLDFEDVVTIIGEAISRQRLGQSAGNG